MTENQIQKRVRRSPEERLQLMLEQQAQLAAQLKAQQKRVAERQARAHAAKVDELGELVLEVMGPISATALKAILLAAKAESWPAPEGSPEERIEQADQFALAALDAAQAQEAARVEAQEAFAEEAAAEYAEGVYSEDGDYVEGDYLEGEYADPDLTPSPFPVATP